MFQSAMSVLVLFLLLVCGSGKEADCVNSANSLEGRNSGLPCVSSATKAARRQWPDGIDFEFYHDPQPPSELPESVQNEISASTTERNRIGITDHSSTTTTTEVPEEQTKPNELPEANRSTLEKHCTVENFEQILKELDWDRENLLLRSVFRAPKPEEWRKFDPKPSGNLSEHFRRRLLRLYRFAAERQMLAQQRPKRASEPDNLNISIFDVQTADKSPKVDVIYILTKDQVPVPLGDAEAMLSYVGPESFRNMTGFIVVEKVTRYDQHNRIQRSETQTASVGLWNWLLILVAALLAILIAISLYVCCHRSSADSLRLFQEEVSRIGQTGRRRSKRKNEADVEGDDDEEVNSESVRRSQRSRSSSRRNRNRSLKSDSSHANLGLDLSPDSETSAPNSSTVQPPLPKVPPPTFYRADLPSPDSVYSKPSILTPISRHIPERSESYPITTNPDYDRISYIKTRETIQEKRRPPNILEIERSKETQAIVKEIKNELNRFNFKKVLPDDVNSSSEA